MAPPIYNNASMGLPVLAGMVKPSRPRRLAGGMFSAVKRRRRENQFENLCHRAGQRRL
jgi:hypothetical protein